MLEAVDAADAGERDDFLTALEKAWANYYPPGGRRRRDAPFLFGRLFRQLGQAEKALTCYRASLTEYGAHCSTLRNMGACHEDLGEHGQALAHYRRALELRPDSIAETAVARLESQSNHVTADAGAASVGERCVTEVV